MKGEPTMSNSGYRFGPQLGMAFDDRTVERYLEAEQKAAEAAKRIVRNHFRIERR